jgi:starch phosphorylase
MSAPIADFKGPVGPANFTRPKHKRTVTGFGPSEIKSVEASIPEPQRDAWRKFVSHPAYPTYLELPYHPVHTSAGC